MDRVRPAALCTLAAAFLLLLVAGCVSLRTDSFSETLTLTSSSSSGTGLVEAIRSSLAAESWLRNHTWTADGEWEHRRGSFPSAKDLRWRFAKAWNTSIEKDETAAPIDVPVDSPASAAVRPDTAKTELPTRDKTGSPAKNAAAISKTDSSAATPADETGNASDKSSQPEIAPHWDGFWPLTVSDLLHRAEKTPAGSRVAATPATNEGVRCLRRLAHADNLVGWNAAILWAQHDPASAVEVADILETLIVNPPQYVAEDNSRSSLVNKEGPSHARQANAKQTSDDKSSSSTGGAADKSGSPHDPSSSKSTKTLSAATRCAAAEAWCLVLAASAADPIDGLAPAGRLLERTGLPNEIRAELFRGLARWVRPANIPRLENALREGEGKQRPPTGIRRAAIDACLVYAIWHQPAVDGRATTVKASASADAKSAWPETVMNCRFDPDLEVRSAFIRWLGYARAEEAFDLLKTQADGTGIGLRQAAMESLATLHTEQAHAELRAQAVKTHEILRASAVHALAAWGLQDVTPYAHDASPGVRRVVAGELGKHATLDSAIVLSELAVDKNVGVQLAAVQAAHGWPDALAFPLLLHAMRDSSAKTRLAAAQYLAARKKVARSYRFDGPPEEREAAVTAIATEIGSSLSYLDQVLKREPRATAEVNELRSAEIRTHLATLIENPADSAAAAAAREWLAGIGTRDIPLVESYLQGPTRVPPDAIYHDVLPKVGPAYAALVDLESADVNIRRRGAKTLADRGQAATLSRPVLRRLRELLSHEADEVVWRSAMTAVASDSTDECADVANLALQHRSAEVRQLGCEYLAHHGQPAHAVWLLDLIEDHSRSVQLAAVRALGNCGNQVAVRGLKPSQGRRTSPNLRSLLTSPDQELRFAAAASLCRLGAAEGMQELVRLSYHTNPHVREHAVKEMGLSAQTRFVEHLVTLGWTEQNDQVRRTILESLDRLVPPENRPPAVGGTTASDAKIKCWVQWLERRNGAPAQNVPAGAPLTSRPERES
jgi:HEAT repeat protein